MIYLSWLIYKGLKYLVMRVQLMHTTNTTKSSQLHPQLPSQTC